MKEERQKRTKQAEASRAKERKERLKRLQGMEALYDNIERRRLEVQKSQISGCSAGGADDLEDCNFDDEAAFEDEFSDDDGTECEENNCELPCCKDKLKLPSLTGEPTWVPFSGMKEPVVGVPVAPPAPASAKPAQIDAGKPTSATRAPPVKVPTFEWEKQAEEKRLARQKQQKAESACCVVM